MFAGLSKTIAQLSDPAFRGVLWRAIGASALVFLVLWVLAWFGLSWVGDWLSGWLAAQQADGFWVGVLEFLFDALALFAVFFASFLLFPAVVSLAMAVLLDDIAAAVERRHYPDLPAPRAQPWGETIGDAVSFALVTIVVNLLALPVYLLLLFVPPLNLFVFYGINGYLLGREYFEMVAVRRLESAAAKQLRRRYRGRVFLAGVIIAFILTIPLVNLIAPIVATGFLVHLFEGLRRQAAARA